MNRRNCLFFSLPLVALLLVSGCVAQKQVTVYNTLKGDNSVTQAMVNSRELPESGFTMLSDVTDKFSGRLAGATPARKVYLDRANIRDVSTGDVANFSSYLQNDLEASLSGLFQLQVLPEKADLLLGATFQRYGNQVKIFFKYHSPDFSINKTFDYGIERHRLPADSFVENLRSKAYRLAANIVEDDEPRKVYVKPLVSASTKCIGPFSRAFSTFVKTEIVRMHRQLVVVDEKPVREKLSDTRAIQQKTKEVDNLESSDAFFADADSVLAGEYVVNGRLLTVTLMLKDLQGHLINSSNVDIERDLIEIPLEDEAVEKLSDLVDKKSEDSGRMVKISTSRSGDFPVYHNGERIVFFAQVKEPLYLYIYTIDREGGVSLLYPFDGDYAHRKTFPGSLVAIPDESDDWELFAEPPFGKDAVKVFASPVELPVPALSGKVSSRSYRSGVRAIGKMQKLVQNQLAQEKTINPNDLVDYYRGLAQRFNIKVFEDSLIVETSP